MSKDGRRGGLTDKHEKPPSQNEAQATPGMEDLQSIVQGFGMALHVNPFGGLRDPAAFAQLSPQEQRKAESRMMRMLKSMDGSVGLREQQAAVQYVADRYPVCAAEGCAESARFRCGTCLSATQKYCSSACRNAHRQVHMETCQPHKDSDGESPAAAGASLHVSDGDRD